MSERLTKWEGRDPDGTPRAVLVKREGPFAPILQEALRKLARYEDDDEQVERCVDRLISDCIGQWLSNVLDEEERRADDIRHYDETRRDADERKTGKAQAAERQDRSH